MKLIYLASPYLYRGTNKKLTSHLVERERYEAAVDATAHLMNKGLAVYSPIVATHPVAVKHKLPLGSEFWLDFDELLLRKCDEIVVLMLDGWKDSPGVKREIEIMKQLNRGITYLDPREVIRK